ncbi:hypothetical protein AB0B13_33020 [Streptomyces sp. NPDC042898]|uniref:hypothetical protein n=1 Tax=Streptomyces sp. NPDC042898 TaxID=3154334 RepID=UPI0033C3CC2D
MIGEPVVAEAAGAVGVGGGQLVEALEDGGDGRLAPVLAAVGDGVGDVDQRDEVAAQVEPVEDFAVGADTEGGLVQRQVVQQVGMREVVQLPFGVREIAGPRAGPVRRPRVGAGDGAAVRVQPVTANEDRRPVLVVQELTDRAPALGRAPAASRTDGRELVGDAPDSGFPTAPLVLGQLPRQVDPHREVGAVLTVLRPLREVQARVPGAQQDTALPRLPRQGEDAVAQEDHVALNLLDPERQQLLLGPRPQQLLHGARGVSLRGRLVVGVLCAGDADGLLGAEEVSERGVHDLRRVAQLSTLGPVVVVAA